jgi:hypothetical protein
MRPITVSSGPLRIHPVATGWKAFVEREMPETWICAGWNNDIVRATRWRIFDPQVDVVFEPSVGSPPEGWELGYSPIDTLSRVRCTAFSLSRTCPVRPLPQFVTPKTHHPRKAPQPPAPATAQATIQWRTLRKSDSFVCCDSRAFHPSDKEVTGECRSLAVRMLCVAACSQGRVANGDFRPVQRRFYALFTNRSED